MKISVSLIVFLLALSVQSQPLTSLDSSQFFDFWVGEWTASWDEGNGIVELGTNSITKNLDNQVLVEQFRIIKGQNAGFKGTSISVFQSRSNTWRQAWADNQGGYYDFIGEFVGEKRIFKTHPREVNGNIIIQRMVFYDLKDSAMTWDWEISNDSGQSWNLSWRIYYTRR